MNNRTDYLLDNQLVTRLQSIQAGFDQLRTAQRVSGAGGALNYKTSTANMWDWNETIGTDGDGLTHNVTFTITYTGDGTQQFPAQMCVTDIFINSPSVTTGPIEANRLSPLAPSWTDGTRTVTLASFSGITTNQVEQYVASDPAYYTDPLIWHWQVRITSFSARFTYWMKATSVGTSTGSLSVSRVAT